MDSQLLLHQNFLELAVPELRKHILIVLQKLCEKSMLYPTCYTLDGIEDISPKGAGGFCDIYQGRYQGQNLCLKVVRLYEKQDQHEMLKVGEYSSSCGTVLLFRALVRHILEKPSFGVSLSILISRPFMVFSA